jgi:thiosulfate dehydrogenase [quinone] large subunit
MSDPRLPLVARVRTSPRLRDPAWVLLPLRAFLGLTFVYAGLLKLTDSTYLDPTSPTSVQAQMLRAAKISPIEPLVSLSAHMATATGLLIAFGELAVGIGTLLGLWTRLAALGGLALSLSFFLTVSWNTRPYFFGSDIVFFFAWTTLLIAGDGGLYSVTNAIRDRVRRNMGIRLDRPLKPAVAAEVQRRTVLQTGGLAAAVGGFAVLTGGMSAWAAHRRARSATPSGPVLTPSSAPSATPAPTTSGGATATPSATASVSGTALGPASTVTVGQAVSYTDPNGGGPAYVVQPTKGQYKAFSAICSHAGCTVQFQSGGFICPCHGSQFDGTSGAVLNGPAPSGLSPIAIKVVGGTIYET